MPHQARGKTEITEEWKNGNHYQLDINKRKSLFLRNTLSIVRTPLSITIFASIADVSAMSLRCLSDNAKTQPLVSCVGVLGWANAAPETQYPPTLLCRVNGV